jgi:hypothetical protein
MVDDDEATDVTPGGLEIPIPKREAVIRNLKKVAKPKPQNGDSPNGPRKKR